MQTEYFSVPQLPAKLRLKCYSHLSLAAVLGKPLRMTRVEGALILRSEELRGYYGGYDPFGGFKTDGGIGRTEF